LSQRRGAELEQLRRQGLDKKDKKAAKEIRAKIRAMVAQQRESAAADAQRGAGMEATGMKRVRFHGTARDEDFMTAPPPPPIGSFWGGTGRAPGLLYGFPARMPLQSSAADNGDGTPPATDDSDTNSSYCVEVPRPHEAPVVVDLTGTALK